MTTPALKDLLKDNTVRFSRYRKGHLYYSISERFARVEDQSAMILRWEFPVPVEDVGDATFGATEKALLFMRYIRKAQEEGSFVRVT